MTVSFVWRSTFRNRIKLVLDLAREGFSIREMLRAWKATTGSTLTLSVTIGQDGITNTQEAHSHLNTKMQEWLRKHARPSIETAS